MIKQRTIQKSVQTSGVGLHNGEKVTLILKPAEVDQGIVFRRVDQKENHEVKVSPDAVKDTKMCSAIGQDASREKNHNALRLISEAGHEIGNHSFNHEPWLHLYEEEEIIKSC